MAKFAYTARDKKGTVKKGTVDAYTEREVVSRLQSQGLWVTVVTPAHEADSKSSKLGGAGKRF